MPKKQSPETKTPSFEKSLTTLQKLVARLEKGELDLETSLAEFEQGIALTRQCQQALEAAEQKVKILLDEHGEPEPFDEYDDDLDDDDDDDFDDN